MPDKQYQIDADTRKFEFSMQKIDHAGQMYKVLYGTYGGQGICR